MPGTQGVAVLLPGTDTSPPLGASTPSPWGPPPATFWRESPGLGPASPQSPGHKRPQPPQGNGPESHLRATFFHF